MNRVTEGNTVRFIGADDAQVMWGGYDDPRKLLQLDAMYVVSCVDVHNWSTAICLDGVEGKFNSVCFNVV